jgi:hypothetical protein
MRRLENEKEREEKRSKNVAILSFILLGIMVISSAGFAFISSREGPNAEQEEQEYTGEGFIKEINGKKLYFQFKPEEVQNISVSPFVKKAESYFNKPLYISAKSDVISREIASTLGLFISRIQRVCYGECTENLPERNCTEESDEKIIVWIDSEKEEVYETNGCVFIEGNLRSADAFLYRIFGIS